MHGTRSQLVGALASLIALGLVFSHSSTPAAADRGHRNTVGIRRLSVNAGRGPRAFDVQIPGAIFPFDRCTWSSGEGPARLMDVRDAVPDDLEAIVEIYNLSIPDRTATADIEPVTVADRRHVVVAVEIAIVVRIEQPDTLTPDDVQGLLVEVGVRRSHRAPAALGERFIYSR